MKNLCLALAGACLAAAVSFGAAASPLAPALALDRANPALEHVQGPPGMRRGPGPGPGVRRGPPPRRAGPPGMRRGPVREICRWENVRRMSRDGRMIVERVRVCRPARR
jgi:hypothetical protein